MTATERWVVGFLLMGICTLFYTDLLDIRHEHRTLQETVTINSARLSTVEQRETEFQNQLDRRDTARQRELDYIRAELDHHRRATERK